MKKLISGLLTVILVVSMSCTDVFAFDDTQDHWANDIIQHWLAQEYMDDLGDFRPDDSITRAEFVDFIYGAFDLQQADSGAPDFTDVTEDAWYYDAVMAVAAAGYISGYPDGTFGPGDTITREEVAVILCKITESKEAPDYAADFSDSGLLGWSKGYVGACVKLGILLGDADGSFRPLENMTRAEAIACLDAALIFVLEQTQPETPATVPIESGSVSAANITTAAYGPANGTLTVTGKATVSSTSSTTTIRNLDIKGDMVVQKGVKNLELINVTIAGKLILNGGTTVTLNNSDIRYMNVNNARNSMTVNITNRSIVYNTIMVTSASLTDSYGAGSYGFKNVTINEDAAKNTTFNLRGDFTTVTIEAPYAYVYLKEGSINELVVSSGAKYAYVTLSSKTTVDEAWIYARYVKIMGSGKIYWAKINASNVTIEKRPNTVTGSYTAGYGSSRSDHKYSYTMRVMNSYGAAVPDAEVYIDGTYYTTDEDGEVTFRLYGGDYSYKIYHKEFYTKSGRLSVSKSSSSTFRLEYKNRYDITIQVLEGNTPVANATVTLSGYTTRITDSNGTATFTDMEAGHYSANVSYGNYDTITKHFTVSGYTSISVVLPVENATYAVAVTVLDDAAPIENAAVTLSGQSTLTTNPCGIVTFTDVKAGDYTIVVTHEAYDTQTIPITINSAVNKTIILTKKAPNTAKAVLYFKDEDTDALITNGLTVNGNAAANGVYTLTDVIGSTYHISANAPGYQEVSENDIMTADKEETYYMKLINPGAVKFILQDEEDTVLTGYTVTGSYTGPNGYMGNISGASSSEGIVANGLAPGEYTYILSFEASESKTGSFTISEGATTETIITVPSAEGEPEQPEPPENTTEEPAQETEPDPHPPEQHGEALIENDDVLEEKDTVIIEKDTLEEKDTIIIEKDTIESKERLTTEEDSVTIKNEPPDIDTEKPLRIPEADIKLNPPVEEKEPLVSNPETASVTFSVSGLKGVTATISIGGSTYQTRGGSVTTGKLTVGRYQYTVSANGYESVSGVVNVTSSGAVISVKMSPTAAAEAVIQQRRNQNTEKAFQPEPDTAQYKPAENQSNINNELKTEAGFGALIPENE